MRFRLASDVLVILGFTLFGALAGVTEAADPDWKAVEQAVGKTGQLQAGDVFRIGMPRTDLNVTVKGVPVRAGFALGSYAAFKQVGSDVMVMGDLVLLDQEVPAVMSGLFSGGLEVTAVHPLAALNPLWLRFHGITRPESPTAADLLAILSAMGLRARHTRWNRPAERDYASVGELGEVTRRRLCLPPERASDVEAALLDLGTQPGCPGDLGSSGREVVTMWWEGSA